jgi:hypothetical protein
MDGDGEKENRFMHLLKPIRCASLVLGSHFPSAFQTIILILTWVTECELFPPPLPSFRHASPLPWLAGTWWATGTSTLRESWGTT